MTKGLKIFAALLGVVAAGGVTDLSTNAVLSTAVAQQCECGNPSCGGCLKGLMNRRSHKAVTHHAVPQETYSNDVVVSTVYGPPIEQHAGCQTCQTGVPCQSCQAAAEPECLYCDLKTKRVEVDKTVFKVEQKEVCVPAVRLPWMKCCPPTKSRVRTVNVLKTDKVKVKTCEYKWNVKEPEEFDDEKEPTLAKVPAQAVSASPKDSAYPDPSADASKLPELSEPSEALNAVPRPPLE